MKIIGLNKILLQSKHDLEDIILHKIIQILKSYLKIIRQKSHGINQLKYKNVLL